MATPADVYKHAMPWNQAVHCSILRWRTRTCRHIVVSNPNHTLHFYHVGSLPCYTYQENLQCCLSATIKWQKKSALCAATTVRTSMKPKTTVKNINATYNLDNTYPSSFHIQLLHINNHHSSMMTILDIILYALCSAVLSNTTASVEHMEQGHDHVKMFAWSWPCSLFELVKNTAHWPYFLALYRCRFSQPCMRWSMLCCQLPLLAVCHHKTASEPAV